MVNEGTYLRPRSVNADDSTTAVDGDIYMDSNGDYFEATCGTTEGIYRTLSNKHPL